MSTPHLIISEIESERSEIIIPLSRNHVKDPIEAVKQIGSMLQFIDSQTLEVCETAVQQDPLALEFTQFQTESMCIDAVRRNGLCLRFVKEQTPLMCLFAVRQNPDAFEFVKEPTDQLRRLAAKKACQGLPPDCVT
jgi:hypothetical protein